MAGSRWSLVVALATSALLDAAEARAGAFAYIPDASGNVVSRYDLATNEALPITVGSLPIGVAASADGSRVVVASATGSVTIIDGVTAAPITTVPLAGSPTGIGITPDGAKAYVADSASGDVTVIDVANATVLDTLHVDGFGQAVAMSPSGHRAYVTHSLSEGALAVIDTALDIVIGDVLVSLTSMTIGAVVSPDGTRVYVGLSDGIAVVDATTNLLLDDVSFGCDLGCPQVMDVTVTPDGSRVYGSLQNASAVASVDAVTLAFTTIATSSPSSSPYGVDVSPDGATLWVVNSNADSIDLIDVASGTIRATLLTLVDFPAALGEFIAGPAPIAPPSPPPVLDAAARSCQKALLDSFKPFGANVHHLLGGCLRRLQVDHASGVGPSSATALVCARDADPANPASRLAKARVVAKQRIASRCGAVTPAALGTPCDTDATSLSEVSDCVLDRQQAAVAGLLADEVAQPCALLAPLGLDDAFPALCP